MPTMAWTNARRGGAQYVVAGERAAYAPAGGVDHADGPGIVGRPPRVPIRGAGPGEALDVAGGQLPAEGGGAGLEGRADIRADHDEARFAGDLRVDVGSGLFHVVAEPLAEPPGRERRLDAFGVDRLAVPGPGRDGDPQASRVATDLLQEGPRGRRRPVGIADVGPRRRVEP